MVIGVLNIIMIPVRKNSSLLLDLTSVSVVEQGETEQEEEEEEGRTWPSLQITEQFNFKNEQKCTAYHRC